MDTEYLLGFVTGSVLVIIVYLTVKVLRGKRPKEAS